VYSGDIDPLFREVDPTSRICLAGSMMERKQINYLRNSHISCSQKAFDEVKALLKSWLLAITATGNCDKNCQLAQATKK